MAQRKRCANCYVCDKDQCPIEAASSAMDSPATTHIAHIAIGANLGNRRENIEHAMDLLRLTPGVDIVRISELIETQAVGGPPDSPPYINGAAELRTTLSPHDLLHRLLAIEATIGRVRKQKWEPRQIDLDLLLYGSQVINTSELQVPHPLMHARRFVLEPLSQIAAEAVHPTLQKTIRELLAALPTQKDTDPILPS